MKQQPPLVKTNPWKIEATTIAATKAVVNGKAKVIGDDAPTPAESKEMRVRVPIIKTATTTVDTKNTEKHTISEF